jgi:hypothetical protein
VQARLKPWARTFLGRAPHREVLRWARMRLLRLGSIEKDRCAALPLDRVVGLVARLASFRSQNLGGPRNRSMCMKWQAYN